MRFLPRGINYFFILSSDIRWSKSSVWFSALSRETSVHSTRQNEYPQGILWANRDADTGIAIATGNIRKMLEWREEHGK